MTNEWNLYPRVREHMEMFIPTETKNILSKACCGSVRDDLYHAVGNNTISPRLKIIKFRGGTSFQRIRFTII